MLNIDNWISSNLTPSSIPSPLNYPLHNYTYPAHIVYFYLPYPPLSCPFCCISALQPYQNVQFPPPPFLIDFYPLKNIPNPPLHLFLTARKKEINLYQINKTSSL